MGADRVGFTNFGEGIQIVDTYTGELREPTKQDVGDSARIVDAIDDVDVFERALGAHDVPRRRPRSTTSRPFCATRRSTPSSAR